MAVILNTRPLYQAEKMKKTFSKHGIETIIQPALEINPDHGEIKKLKNTDCSQYDWVIFTSANAVCISKKHLLNLEDHKNIIAVGPATKAELLYIGVKDVLLPEKFNTSAIVNMINGENKRKVLIITGKNPKIDLNEILSQRGYESKSFYVYERLFSKQTVNSINKFQNVDAILIYSIESLEAFDKILQLANNTKLRTIPLLVLTEKIRNLAIKLGFNNNIYVISDFNIFKCIDFILTRLNRT